MEYAVNCIPGIQGRHSTINVCMCKHDEDQHVFLPHKIDLQTEATKDLLWELNTLRKRK